MTAHKQVQEIAERMKGLCRTLRAYTPKSGHHVGLETVEKWAREIEDAIGAAPEDEGDH